MVQTQVGFDGDRWMYKVDNMGTDYKFAAILMTVCINPI